MVHVALPKRVTPAQSANNDAVCPQQISLPPTRVALSTVSVELKSVVVVLVG